MTEIEKQVMLVVQDIGDPLLSHIVGRMNDCDKESVKETVRNLVQRGWLRMKEDDIDHDWAYRRTTSGREAMEQTIGTT